MRRANQNGMGIATGGNPSHRQECRWKARNREGCSLPLHGQRELCLPPSLSCQLDTDWKLRAQIVRGLPVFATRRAKRKKSSSHLNLVSKRSQKPLSQVSSLAKAVIVRGEELR
ncbi:hypothetical protein BC827DRAFT_1386940 [Russula dissimulans]|nr:hypothetical protein BC827DRAFT_1386940 [Russula dissimulans]